MTILALTEFFKWWAILGGVLYAFTALVVVLAPNFLFSVQGRMFDIKEEPFKIVLYSYMALFKALYLLFVFIPYLALLMMA